MSWLPPNIPIVQLLWNGDRDRGYGVLILCGPLVIGSIALLGRSVLTTTLTAGYILTFILYLLWIWVTA